MKLPNITYTGEYSKYVENSEDPNTCIMFYKDNLYFEDAATYNSFIKAVEAMIRRSDDYKYFISRVRSDFGLNFCQVSSEVVDIGDESIIEMHHGPLFTLYDYVAIILNKFISEGLEISTFRIAKEVIEEHFALRVQVVMLTKTNHEAVTNGDIFLNLRQGFGNVTEFIRLYANYLTDDQKRKIYFYVNMCKENDSFDNGILDYSGIERLIKF